MRRSLIALACIASSVALALPGVPVGAAERTLSVSPEVGIRGTLPGEAVEETVTIVNLSDATYQVSATLTPLDVRADGTLASEGSSTLPSAALWGSVEPSSFLLPRGHTLDVKVGFKPPQGTSARGYYAAVRFAGETPNGGRTTIVHAMLLEVGGSELQRSARVAGISAPARAFGTSIPVSVRLENTGNVAVMASGLVKLRDSLSRVTAVVPIIRTPVIPGHPRTVRINVPAPMVPGGVRVSAEVGFGTGVPRDSASTTAFALTWWQAAVVALVLFVLARVVLWLVRRRRRRKAVKRRAPAALPVPEPAARADALAAAPGAARPRPILADDEMQSFWEEETPRPYEPVPEMEAEAASEEKVVSWAPPPDAFAPQPEVDEWLAEEEPATVPPEPEAEEEPEPALVPPAAEADFRDVEPEELPEPVVLAAVPAAEPEPIEPEPAVVAHDAEEDSGARVSHLVDRVKAGIPAGPPGGLQAGVRRARVAIELMTERGARSAERIDVGLSLLRWARGDEVVTLVEDAFEQAATAGKRGAVAALALAMAEVRSPRSLEALLRAYAQAPRTYAKRLRDTLHNYPQEELRDRGELLDALPPDRRSALKVG